MIDFRRFSLETGAHVLLGVVGERIFVQVNRNIMNSLGYAESTAISHVVNMFDDEERVREDKAISLKAYKYLENRRFDKLQTILFNATDIIKDIETKWAGELLYGEAPVEEEKEYVNVVALANTLGIEPSSFQGFKELRDLDTLREALSSVGYQLESVVRHKPIMKPRFPVQDKPGERYVDNDIPDPDYADSTRRRAYLTVRNACEEGIFEEDKSKYWEKYYREVADIAGTTYDALLEELRDRNSYLSEDEEPMKLTQLIASSKKLTDASAEVIAIWESHREAFSQG